MITSRESTVPRAGLRRVFEIGARKVGFAVVLLGLAFGVARAAGVNPEQPLRLDGIELFFGIVPAEILRGHPPEHEEQTMHGGVPRGKGVHHLIVSIFDAKTHARITDAVVAGSVTQIGMATQHQNLAAMSFGGAASYGNYFAMPARGPYEIVVTVRRPGSSGAATARFQYRISRQVVFLNTGTSPGARTLPIG